MRNALLLLMFLYTTVCEAQVFNSNNIFRPRIYLKGEYETPGKLSSQEATFSYGKTTIGTSLPVFKKLNYKVDSGVKAWNLKAHGSFSAGFPQSDIFFTHHTLYNASAGLGWNYLVKKSIVSINALAFITEDN